MFQPNSAIVPWIGAIGDTITLVAGVLLAYDAIHEAAQHKEVQKMANVVEAHQLRNIRIKVKGVVAKDHDGVEYAYIRRSSRRALWGAVTLCVGFGFLLVGRIMEVATK